MKVLIWGVAIIYLCDIAITVVSLFYVQRWFSNNRKTPANRSASNLPIYLLIPMLHEQAIAKSTYEHFWGLIKDNVNYHAVFITTEKETKTLAGKVSTRKILEEAKVSLPCPRMHLLHYPLCDGVMAHQLNCAVRELREKHNNGNFWIGVYNADSRVPPATIDFINMQTANGCAFQQYTWYSNLVRQNSGSILGSAVLWQNRWSLGYELPRLLWHNWLVRQLWGIRDRTNNFWRICLADCVEHLLGKMNYVIGHGMFVDSHTLAKVGDFSENTINEDAILGYIFNALEIPIYPIPYLESSIFASNLNIYVKQQATWFNGPWYAFQYLQIYWRMRNSSNDSMSLREAFRSVILSLKLFWQAINWLLSPMLLLFLFPVLLYKFYGFCGILTWFLIVMLYLPFIHWVTAKVLPECSDVSDVRFKPSLLFCVIFFVIHCAGPFYNLYRQIRGANTIQTKYKTERQQNA